VSPAKLPPCPYPAHRGADWRLRGSKIEVCGICHPAADGIDAVALKTGKPVAKKARAGARRVGEMRLRRSG